MRKMIKETRQIIVILMIAFFAFSNCEDTTNSENPAPGKVLLVSKSPENEAVETGIDAEYILGPPPPRNGIIIQWHPVQDDDLAGYRVYRSAVDSLTAFNLIATVRTQSAGKIDTSYFDTDTNVVAHARYYYRISAEDAEQEGPKSNAADYQLEEVCIPNFPPPFSSIFKWQSPTIHTGSFIFRLAKRQGLEGYKSFWITELHDEYTPSPEKSLSELGLDSLGSGQYRWRIDVLGLENNNGSESAWLDFSVQ